MNPARLLNIYMKPLAEFTGSFGLHCRQYVDGMQLYLALPSECKRTVETLNQGPEAVMGGISANKMMMFIPDLTEVLLVGRFWL